MSIQDIITGPDYLSADQFYASADDYKRGDCIAGLEALGLPLPGFLKFPTPRTAVVKWDGEMFTCEHADEPQKSLRAMDRHLSQWQIDMVFDETIASAPGVKLIGGMALEDGGRMTIEWLNPREQAAMKYWGFLDLAKQYIADPKNFVNAYYFLDNHPAFWHLRRHGELDWIFDGFAKKFYTIVHPSDRYETGVMVGFEAGGTAPGWVHHYHDLRIDTYAGSFEDAYIQLAANVHEHFDLDGTDYEKGSE